MDSKEKSLREKLGNSWYELLKNEFDSEYMITLGKRIATERNEGKYIYPESKDIFNAFKLTPYENVKVVILGQDPYHTQHSEDWKTKRGIAHGLAFSSQDPATLPPSLENIFKEIEDDIKFGLYLNGDYDLTYWADQGVFLLNKVLTVEKGKAGSHKGWGWEVFTMKVIKHLVKSPNRLVFILWGADAREYKSLIPNDGYHLVLEAAHPAAEQYKSNAGFFGCKHFSKTNKFLKENYGTEINW
jgi:uracil-DNA glycosylase